MLCYVDASFLARAVTPGSAGAAARALLEARRADMVTSAVTRAELWPLVPDQQERVDALALLEELPEIRFSDRGLEQASLVVPALPPFVALQVGAMLTTEELRDVATYDRTLAQACKLFRLEILSPGLPDLWYV